MSLIGNGNSANLHKGRTNHLERESHPLPLENRNRTYVGLVDDLLDPPISTNESPTIGGRKLSDSLGWDDSVQLMQIFEIVHPLALL